MVRTPAHPAAGGSRSRQARVEAGGLSRARHHPVDDGGANAGNKSLGFRGIHRLEAFAQWAADRPESHVIVGGHSLWFRSFFQRYLDGEHNAAKKKIVNCGVIAFDLKCGKDASGNDAFNVDSSTVRVIYGGFGGK